MHNPKALPLATQGDSPKLAIWADPSGTPYLVKQQPDGSTTFTPMEAALSQLQPAPQPSQRSLDPDPLRSFLLGIAVVLGLVLLGYGFGFLAGASGRSVVVVPRSPVCDTHRSSFLFWSNEQKECN